MQNELIKLARREIVEMKPYSSARSLKKTGNIWLDANENPWNDTIYNRYPEPQSKSLLSLFSSLYKVNEEQILITRGSDEGIDLLIRLFCYSGLDQIMICPPTYGMYKVAATIQGADVIEVPLLKEFNFSLQIEKMFERWKPTVKLIFLCSPNNPTGNLLSIDDIVLLCKTLNNKSIIVVDEAYIEFSENPSFTNYIKQYPNLIVLRTLSKAYGLAGLRCGVTIGNPGIIALLKKIIAPYPISQSVLDILYQKINNNDVQNRIDIIRSEKKKLFQFLSNLSFVKTIWESDANFILFEVLDVAMILEICNQHGIVLRDRGHDYNLKNCIRSTIGKPEENTFLMEVLSRA